MRIDGELRAPDQAVDQSRPPADEYIGRAFLAVGATVVLWASAFVAIRIALVSIPPVELTVSRFAVSSLANILVAWAVGIKRPAGRDVPRLLLLGVVGIAAYNVCLNIGAQHLPAGTTSFLINTGPIMAAIMVWLARQEQPTVRTILGSIVAFTGASIIAGSRGYDLQFSTAALMVLLAAFLQGSFFVIQKALLKRYRPVDVTMYAIWIGTLAMIPFGGGTASVLREASWGALAAVLYLGLGSGSIAYFTWAYALKHLPVTRAVNCLYAVPPVTILVGWIGLGELPVTVSLLGGALALTGVWIVNAARAPRRDVDRTTLSGSNPRCPSLISSDVLARKCPDRTSL